MSMDNQKNTTEASSKPERVTVFTLIGSLFAGWFGVQSNRNRERDFTHGKASTFIFAGIIFMLLFVLTVWGIVQLVMSLATP